MATGQGSETKQRVSSWKRTAREYQSYGQVRKVQEEGDKKSTTELLPRKLHEHISEVTRSEV